tara:strand:+ start:3653 stop:4366 length:714 start_codon:yes stop_codon:yes gene_type:complete
MRKYLLNFPKFTGPLRAYYNKYFGEKEINYLFKEFKKYKNKYIFYDVGANYGIFTFLFGRLSVFTITFDPIKECIEYIKRGYIYKNILLVNQAVSDKQITLNINIPIEGNEKIFGKSSITNQFDSSETRSIQTVTLDHYFEDIKKLNTTKLFIKIDVEGSEYNVLNGGMNTLASFDVLLLIEIEKRHNKNYMEIFNKLKSLNFQAFCFVNNDLKLISDEDDVEAYMNINNNFIFKNY